MTEDQKRIVFVLSLVLVVAVAALLLLTVETINGEVSGHNWRREIQIQNYAPRSESNWWYLVPADAYDRVMYRAVSGYRTVKVGESCTGTYPNRTCTDITRREAEYDWMVNYTVDRWRYFRSIVAMGSSRNDEIVWPELDFTPCEQLYCERTGNYVEQYLVYFQWDEGTFACPQSQAMWSEYRVGDAYSLEMGKFLRIPRCETLKPTRS